MTNPWNRTRPELPRRAGGSPARSWPLASFPRSLSRAEREEFVKRLLARLPAPTEEPASTTELGDHFELDQYRRSNLLWTSLARLAREGLVEKVVRDGQRVRYWRRAAVSEQQDDKADPTPRDASGSASNSG